VTEALEALRRGDRTLEQVEELFGTRVWPRGRDTDRSGPGSFAEVADAYSTGVIDHDQYVRLANAAAAAMKTQQEQDKAAPGHDHRRGEP
jgi:hypothetical protein